MSDPTFCQSAYRCDQPRAYTVWFRSATGYQWSEGLCRRDSSVRSDQVRAEGGQVVSVEEIAAEVTP